MHADNRLWTEIQICSDPAECPRIRRLVSRLATAKLRDRAAAGDITLAVGEAFSNAIKYGSQGKISVMVDAMSPREIVVEMRYPGGRFDTHIRYPSEPASGDGGFGRYIMDEVLDGMEYSFDDGCTCVRMHKKLS